MAATPNSPLSADSGGTPATVGGGIARLNPSDGLFLRAQHLTVMEDYALALAQSAAQATGAGVVYGYRVWLDGMTLKVDAGLAIAPDGRPLRSTNVAELDLSALTVTNDGFYVVEVGPATWAYDLENVYGNLCDDPCSNSTVIHPYQAEGIVIDLSTDSMQGLSSQANAGKRNWLASQYYERERKGWGPWLVPGPGSIIADIDPLGVIKASKAPEGATVPLAVLLKLDDGWHVDLWIARRDLGDPAPRRAWQSKLAMRPWDAFIAQVLQFQAQLAALYQAGPVKSAAAEELAQAIGAIRDQFATMRVKPNWLKDRITDLEKALPQLGKEGLLDGGLLAAGFGELPPAGFLPPPPQGQEPDAYAERLFGQKVKVRVCRCRADHVMRAIEQAQHLDRIPLDEKDQKGTPSVDVLIPTERADLAPLYTESYPWMAFVRRSDRTCPSERPVDKVAVYLVETSEDAEDVARIIVKEVSLPKEEYRVGWLTYPADTCAVPTPSRIYDSVHDSAAWRKGTAGRKIICIGLASAQDRQPLAAARAALLDLHAETETETGEVKVDNIRVAYRNGLSPEAIVIVVGESTE